MTGPHLLAAVAYDEYYDDTKRMIADFDNPSHRYPLLTTGNEPEPTEHEYERASYES